MEKWKFFWSPVENNRNMREWEVVAVFCFDGDEGVI
jgi:hypothetical protein